MTELILPVALDALERLVHSEVSPSPVELAQHLRVLQRLGMAREDLVVHVERLRAINDIGPAIEQVDENALLALEMIAGSTRFALSWGPAETACAWLPLALTRSDIDAGAWHALVPSDLLPARPQLPAENALIAHLSERQWLELARRNYVPTTATFFRSPKAGLTTRPAALLSPQDRLVYEALAEHVLPSLTQLTEQHVVWPRDRTQRGNYSEYAEAPRTWDCEFIVRTDIASYYESIDHAFLAIVLRENLGVGGAFAVALEAFLDTVMSSNVGLPQGPAASDVLASAYLTDIDQEVVRLGWDVKRYADDMLIGASSFAEARQRVRDLEALLRERGLRLSQDKTRVVQAKTYVRTLDEPSDKQAFRRVVSRVVEEWLEEHPSIDQDEILRGVGVPEELLWDLLYHQTITLSAALEQVGDRLSPPWIDAYERVFATEAERLRSGGYADDPEALTTSELRECLLFMTGGSKPTWLGSLGAVIGWHPALARDISNYLTVVGRTRPGPVAQFLADRISGDLDSDLELAWLIDSAVNEQTISDALTEGLIALTKSDTRPLSRATAVRALAGSGHLAVGAWEEVLRASSPALRAELLLAKEADPDLFPDAPAGLELGTGSGSPPPS
ncbi:hypothetical protein GCM10023258_37070 [Terrabacter aeriphilus]|uniref:Reverse transcriptase domain-containing protein n=1 Tax=Terrabacter aeriphilus TaxID=515662 RepID=A0ABP9JL39_9MICO